MLGDHATPVAAGIFQVRADIAVLDGGLQGGGGGGGGSEDGGSASKASKNGKSSADDSPSINIQPFTCPGKCVDANGVDGETNLLEDVIVDCNEEDKGQEWIEHREGNVVSYESVLFPGWCLAVEHEHNLAHVETGELLPVHFNNDFAIILKILGPVYIEQFSDVYPTDWAYLGVNLNTNTNTTVDACTDGVVGLIPCGCPSTKWYNAGSQLLSLSCWEAGFSTSMSVDYDDESGECLSQLKSIQDDSGDVTWASTFMLKETGNSAGGLGFYDPLG